MTSDLNKGISSVEYNHLNMPTKITVTGSNAGTLDYVYSADRTKLRKINSNGTTTDYIGNYVYEGGSLKQISHPEGYIEPDGQGGYDYVYYLKDHQGNVRITFADDNDDGNIDPSNEIRREQNYYPFGLEHKGYNSVTYGVENNLKTYQNQEFTKDLGLNVHEWRYRFGDPAIARFWQVDPLAEDYVYNGVYNFSENDPISSIELEGLEKLSVHVYNVIQNNDGSYTAKFAMESTSSGHDWSGTKSQYQLQVVDSYDRKTVTGLYAGDNALADARRDGVEISQWQGRDVRASDIIEGAKNNPEFQKAGKTLGNVATAGGMVLSGGGMSGAPLLARIILGADVLTGADDLSAEVTENGQTVMENVIGEKATAGIKAVVNTANAVKGGVDLKSADDVVNKATDAAGVVIDAAAAKENVQKVIEKEDDKP